MNSLEQIVDLEKHPLNQSTDYLNNCKERLKKKSVLQLDEFLLPASLNIIQKEANELHSKAFYCSQKHTILLNKNNIALAISLGLPIFCRGIFLANFFFASGFFFHLFCIGVSTAPGKIKLDIIL